ncbi:20779_t:CDS:2 [Cetraspora pellucida]|uniref:20779_t:CDS:1 n=1 Tax=Cetraspora pellucida TaxID=1433469 RepID=A0A9N9A7V4_9GLOM|nr:20779_t:CDS:2 [Cetraspora pellucida]
MATKLMISEIGFEEWMDGSINIKEISQNSEIFHQYDKFENFEVIGNGSRGVIRKAFSITYQKNVVLKEISQSQNYSLRELINDVQKYQKIDNHDNILKLFGLTTQEYLQNIKTFKLTKRSDIYSLGVLFWELSSGMIPFESETLSDLNLLNSIIQGKRETVVDGTPRAFVKIYTDCWQFKSKHRPNINQIFQSLQDVNLSDTIQTENISPDLSVKKVQNEKKIKLKVDSKGIQDLIQAYQDQYDNKAKELDLLGTFLKTLKQSDNARNSFSNSLIMTSVNQSKLIIDKIQNTIGELTASNVSDKLYENSANISSSSQFGNLEKISNNSHESASDKLSSFKFILDLFQYFFKNFDTYEQHNSIRPNLIKYFQNNNKNPANILNHLIDHKHHLYFTGIIGFFFQYGIGTTINHKKAIEMYAKVTELKDTFDNAQFL